MNNPFFSVCIPVTNRERTIYNTLRSVARQTNRDFEVIIVESGSTDRSKEEIQRFFASAEFANSPFEYIYNNGKDEPQTVEDWNYPLELASGNYIAMLEGDDQFLPDHLADAYQFLMLHRNIGLYAVGNQIRQRSIRGIINNSTFIEMEVAMEDPAPPSEAIFVRCNKNGEPYLYNVKDYEYCPEVDLYIRIGIDGFDAYHSDKCDVIRDINPKPWNIFHYYTDRFTILQKYEHLIDKDTFINVYNKNLAFAAKGSLIGFPSKTLKFCRQMSRKIGIWDFAKALYLLVYYHIRLKFIYGRS